MSKFIVEWIENGVVAGKAVKRCSLKDEAGSITENVTIWSADTKGVPFPSFDKLTLGGKVEGELKEGKGGYGPTLYPPKNASVGSQGSFSEASAKRTIEVKAEHIARAQDAKGESIKIASTFTAARETALAELGEEFTEQQYMERFKFWRAWHYNNWEMHQKDIEEAPPFDN